MWITNPQTCQTWGEPPNAVFVELDLDETDSEGSPPRPLGVPLGAWFADGSVADG
jgi:hypothetical protein